jgi:hypothetical protein
MEKFIEATHRVIVINRQEGKPRGIDHVIEAYRIRKKEYSDCA